MARNECWVVESKSLRDRDRWALNAVFVDRAAALRNQKDMTKYSTLYQFRVVRYVPAAKGPTR